MICPHCGASISEFKVQCPYCDSFVEHNFENDPEKIIYKSRDEANFEPRNSFASNFKPEDDKIRLVLLLVSFIPIFGVIIGAILITAGLKKSGTVYLLIGCSFFLLPILFSILAVFYSLLFG